jgi:hypothetical protein
MVSIAVAQPPAASSKIATVSSARKDADDRSFANLPMTGDPDRNRDMINSWHLSIV